MSFRVFLPRRARQSQGNNGGDCAIIASSPPGEIIVIEITEKLPGQT